MFANYFTIAFQSSLAVYFAMVMRIINSIIMKIRNRLDFSPFYYCNLVLLAIVVANHPATVYFRFNLNICFFLIHQILEAITVIFKNTPYYSLALFLSIKCCCFFNHYFLIFHQMWTLSLYSCLTITFPFTMQDYFDFDYLYFQQRRFHFDLHFKYHFLCSKNYYYFDYLLDFLDLRKYDTHCCL